MNSPSQKSFRRVPMTDPDLTGHRKKGNRVATASLSLSISCCANAHWAASDGARATRSGVTRREVTQPVDADKFNRGLGRTVFEQNSFVIGSNSA